MKFASTAASLRFLYPMGMLALLSTPGSINAQQPAAKPSSTEIAAVAAKTFPSPQQAADALVAAAEQFDVNTLREIFGPAGEEIIFSGEYPQDRKRAADFAKEAREKKSVSVEPKKGN